MGRLLDKLKAGAPKYVVEEADVGVVLIRRFEHDGEFTQLVRELINGNPEEFVVLPVSDGQAGYERVVLVPL